MWVAAAPETAALVRWAAAAAAQPASATVQASNDTHSSPLPWPPPPFSLPPCRRYNRELPYLLQPQLLKCYLRRHDNTYRIHQVIPVEKGRTRAIVVGPKGEAIQHYVVARAARELEQLTGRKVELTVGCAGCWGGLLGRAAGAGCWGCARGALAAGDCAKLAAVRV